MLVFGIIFGLVEIAFIYVTKQVMFTSKQKQILFRGVFFISLHFSILLRIAYFWLTWAAPNFHTLLLELTNNSLLCETNYPIYGWISFCSSMPLMFTVFAFICFMTLLAHFMMNSMGIRNMKYRLLKYILLGIGIANSAIYIIIVIVAWEKNNFMILLKFKMYFDSVSWLLITGVSIHFILTIRKYWNDASRAIRTRIYIILLTANICILMRFVFDISAVINSKYPEFLIHTRNKNIIQVIAEMFSPLIVEMTN